MEAGKTLFIQRIVWEDLELELEFSCHVSNRTLQKVRVPAKSMRDLAGNRSTRENSSPDCCNENGTLTFHQSMEIKTYAPLNDEKDVRP